MYDNFIIKDPEFSADFFLPDGGENQSASPAPVGVGSTRLVIPPLGETLTAERLTPAKENQS